MFLLKKKKEVEMHFSSLHLTQFPFWSLLFIFTILVHILKIAIHFNPYRQFPKENILRG